MTNDAQQLDLSPPYVAMTWYKGRTVPFTVTARDTTGTAINLTSATAVMIVKDMAGNTALTLQTGGSGIVVSNGAGGVLTISPEAVGTGSLSLDKTYSMDLEVTLSGGTVYPFFSGKITVEENVNP